MRTKTVFSLGLIERNLKKKPIIAKPIFVNYFISKMLKSNFVRKIADLHQI